MKKRHRKGFYGSMVMDPPNKIGHSRSLTKFQNLITSDQPLVGLLTDSSDEVGMTWLCKYNLPRYILDFRASDRSFALPYVRSLTRPFFRSFVRLSVVFLICNRRISGCLYVFVLFTFLQYIWFNFIRVCARVYFAEGGRRACAVATKSNSWQAVGQPFH